MTTRAAIAWLAAVLAACGAAQRPRASTECDASWSLAPDGRACARGAWITVTHAAALVARVPRAAVLDETEDVLLVDGPCDTSDENAANATCVVGAGAVGATYLAPATASQPGFPRGAIHEHDGVIATNGLFVSRAEDSNEDSDPGGDVQAELLADGLRDASCARWTVRVPLHRGATGGEMTFVDCAGRDVAVALERTADGYRWRRLTPP